MKKIVLLFTLLVLSLTILAQTPQVFKYQTVVRDAGGGVYANKIVSFRISIVRDNPTGTSVYVETHNTTTNDFGIVNLSIGSGSPVNGSFGAIDWGTHEHFIKTEIDMLGGTNFQFMGTSQLLSVPYALFAGKSANAADDFDKDSTNELQTINKVGNTVTLSDNGGSFIDSDNQTLTLNGTQLQISNGNTVNIGGTVDLDWDPTNELQFLTLSTDTLKLSAGNYILLPPDADADSTNELQTISKNGNQVTLSKNGGSFTDSDNQNLSLTSNNTQKTINISNGTGVTFDIKDADSDSTNELQILSYSKDTLFLSKGNYVVLPHDNDKDSTNEIQNLSIDYKSLSLSKGNTIIVNYGPTFINGVNLSIVTSTFQTVDVSSIVPVNTSALILEVYCSSSSSYLYFRKNPTSQILSFRCSNYLQLIIPVETNRTFEAYQTGIADYIKVVGYY